MTRLLSGRVPSRNDSTIHNTARRVKHKSPSRSTGYSLYPKRTSVRRGQLPSSVFADSNVQRTSIHVTDLCGAVSNHSMTPMIIMKNVKTTTRISVSWGCRNPFCVVILRAPWYDRSSQCCVTNASETAWRRAVLLTCGAFIYYNDLQDGKGNERDICGVDCPFEE